ncbi:acyltransferase family protein [Fictibacillus sp. BK138]|uniref:acyltransferase family protein n=1 Tax=Fictibacillus sp. BK138 TaxID=2512121 RepID=UPI001028CC71|nr:acyltransferase family protein [Fictibacillus sp. BK138]RZT15584.1 peptidoglycan/LPS O-acetylase OafA/YrhL [Fictibacillus sp. BK138]
MELNRRYDIDWLRNLGILLLFPFHSARVFDIWDPFYVKSEELSSGLSIFIAVTSYWFMPLLFWLAGSASWYALNKRSIREYINDRTKRLLIPFIFGLFVIVPPQGYFALMSREDQSLNYLSFLQSYFLNFSDLSGYFGTFTPAHLWFILYLFVLSMLASPLFRFYKKNIQKMNRFHKVFSRPAIFLMFFIILVIVQVLPAPGGQNPFYYLVFLLLGFLTTSKFTYQEMFNKIYLKVIILLMVLVPIWITLLYHNGDHSSWTELLLTILRTLNVWLTLIAILGLGHKYLNVKHKVLPYLNEAAFPIYILHQSILVIIAYFILQLKLSTAVQFSLIMILSLFLSWFFYEYVIKRFNTLRWLFGLKPKTGHTRMDKKPNEEIIS